MIRVRTYTVYAETVYAGVRVYAGVLACTHVRSVYAIHGVRVYACTHVRSTCTQGVYAAMDAAVYARLTYGECTYQVLTYSV